MEVYIFATDKIRSFIFFYSGDDYCLVYYIEKSLTWYNYILLKNINIKILNSTIILFLNEY